MRWHVRADCAVTFLPPTCDVRNVLAGIVEGLHIARAVELRILASHPVLAFEGENPGGMPADPDVPDQGIVPAMELPPASVPANDDGPATGAAVAEPHRTRRYREPNPLLADVRPVWEIADGLFMQRIDVVIGLLCIKLLINWRHPLWEALCEIADAFPADVWDDITGRIERLGITRLPRPQPESSAPHHSEATSAITPDAPPAALPVLLRTGTDPP